MAGSASQVIDTRLLGKPRGYSGNKHDFPTFKYSLMNYLGALSPELADITKAAAGAPKPIIMSALSDAERKNGVTLSYILSQLLTGSSLTLVMNVESNHGLEQWRLLCKREEPGSGAAMVAQLQNILNCKFSGKWNTYIEELSALILQISQFEERNSEIVSDMVVQAIILSLIHI